MFISLVISMKSNWSSTYHPNNLYFYKFEHVYRLDLAGHGQIAIWVRNALFKWVESLTLLHGGPEADSATLK